jgi:hypothetical protein
LTGNEEVQRRTTVDMFNAFDPLIVEHQHRIEQVNRRGWLMQAALESPPPPSRRQLARVTRLTGIVVLIGSVVASSFVL